MDNSKNTGKIIGSLVIGALAGATLGVLFAPRKGTKTRSKITGGADKLAKNLNKKIKNEAKDFKRSFSKETKSLKNKAAKLEDMVEEKMENVTASIKEKANTLLQMNSDHEFNKK
ncbi:YtxH domain-containing protein [Flavobacterium sp.]|jgi:gas vesicle protein|uniref:YtxH domain-containing protein n=1 Tax=Flavobacterium sp. TaxID=239 RepID=UPI0037BFE898